MRKIKQKLHGSTLVETLAMMLVAGVVFLAVMDGLSLFTRLQTRRVEALLTTERLREGYFRLEALVEDSDSILTQQDGAELFRSGRQAFLSLEDSTLFYRTETLQDTLLWGVAAIRRSGDKPDTLEIVLANEVTIRFPVKPRAGAVYLDALERIENEYGYEE